MVAWGWGNEEGQEGGNTNKHKETCESNRHVHYLDSDEGSQVYILCQNFIKL